ncbi:unnamed protein product [Adineta steineri]|uniref:Uncharacterized protein n=1 Tax=Adineta steineri TaxID=433720 RepID=A0A818MAX7_9BILA|nr:unnamed protein product [Adineta steineri]CAF3588564.1 unnamed protein product [Adineta steineri]
MALRTSTNRRSTSNHDESEENQHHRRQQHHNEYDEEIVETEDDLIENYRYLTQRCGALRQSPTTNVISAIQQQQQKQKQTNPSLFSRQYSSISETHNPPSSHHNNNINNTNEFERSFSSTKHRRSHVNDLNNNNHNYLTTNTRVPPTIYYSETGEDAIGHNQSFSLVKLFARMKARLKHDKRYRPRPTHELLYEEDPQEWYELTKNVRTVLTKALLPDGGYDAAANRAKLNQTRQGSRKKSREHLPVLAKEHDDEEKITFEIDDELNTEGDPEFDQIIWEKFIHCTRGYNYRRAGVCKAIDRQYFQGQLAFFYGVANNILIDENLKASGLG